MGLSRSILLWASRQEWLGEQFRRRKFAKRATARFIPGEKLDSALEAASRLQQTGITSLVSRLGENIKTADEANEVLGHYLSVLDKTDELQIPCQISLKPTQLGLDLSDSLCLDLLMALLDRAERSDSYIWIDMEGSPYVDRTLTLFEEAHKIHEHVGICIQAYLYRAEDDLRSLLAQNAAVSLVKGAYNENESIAIQKQQKVDSNFLVLAELMLDARTTGGGLPVFGTHDKCLIGQIINDAEKKKLDPSRYEFQLLYGIARDQQRELADKGHQMRVLISYGEAWFPWYMRRLAERPSNVWFVLRSLFR